MILFRLEILKRCIFSHARVYANKNANLMIRLSVWLHVCNKDKQVFMRPLAQNIFFLWFGMFGQWFITIFMWSKYAEGLCQIQMVHV